MSEYNIQMNKYNALNAEYDQLYPQPMKHASTHAKDGDDPITPSSIGAAELGADGKVPESQLPEISKADIPITSTPDDDTTIWIDPDEDDQTESFYTKAETNELLQNKADKSVAFTVTLTAAGWADNVQTISDARFVSTGYAYTVAPASVSFADYADAMIYADDVTTDGQMVFHCDSAPTADLTVNIVRMVTAE